MFRSASRSLSQAAALGFVAMIAAGCSASPQAEATDQWTKTYPVVAGGTLEIKNTNGSVDVTQSSGASIEIVADRVAHGPNEEAAKGTLKDLVIHDMSSAASVIIESTSHPSNMLSSVPEVNFHVKLPRGTNLKLSGTNQKISVADIDGTIEALNTNGEIHLAGLTNFAMATSTNGAVDLTFTKITDAGAGCSTTNGAVSLTLPKDAHANLKIHTSNGAIHTDNLNMATTESSAHTLEGTLGGGGSIIQVATTNGEVKLKGQ